MFYALNLFDLKDEAVYRKYLKTGGPIVQELGGDLVVMGRRTPEVPVKFPSTTIGGGQRWLIIATYKTEEDVRRFWNHPKNFLDITDEEWERLMLVNGLGVMICMQEAAKQMIKQGKGGKIINTASVAGKQGFALVAHYSATKFAVVGLTQAGARELAPHGITVNAFCPGIVATELWRKLDQNIMDFGRTKRVGQAMEEFSKDILLGRVSTPEDCAGIAAFLASPDSDYMTGQSVQVDGGMVLQ